jgi:hypothetical protein
METITGTSLGLDMDRKTTLGNPTITSEMVPPTRSTSIYPSRLETATSRLRQSVCPRTSSIHLPTNLFVLPPPLRNIGPFLLVLRVLILSNVFNFVLRGSVRNVD